MKKKWNAKSIFFILIYVLILTGCGSSQMDEMDEELLPQEEIRETEPAENDTGKAIAREAEEGTLTPEEAPGESEEVPTVPKEENGLLEIYADGAPISITEDVMIADVSPQEILSGNPIIYDRFRIDSWIFEWLISDYYEDFWEDGVLVVSRENERKDAQVIHVKAEGGYGTQVSIENKFLYADVNFDGVPDLLVCAGLFGNQLASGYYCFLQTNDGFVEVPTFTDISNPAIDAEHNLVRSQWRNSAASHSWGEYKYQDGAYVLDRELREDCVISDDQNEDIWVWTVNGEEIGRSDELSLEEIEDLLYSEKSEWQIMDDRWRTLYNGGLTADYSIYEEP